MSDGITEAYKNSITVRHDPEQENAYTKQIWAYVEHLEIQGAEIAQRLANVEKYLVEQRAQTYKAVEREHLLKKKLEDLCKKAMAEDNEIAQVCGQVLGYPWYEDDQKNFPGATRKDGVCVGEHVGITIAQELANKYVEIGKAHVEALAMLAESQRTLEEERSRWARLRKQYEKDLIQSHEDGSRYRRAMRDAIRRLKKSSHSTEKPEPYESRTPIIAAMLQSTLREWPPQG